MSTHSISSALVATVLLHFAAGQLASQVNPQGAMQSAPGYPIGSPGTEPSAAPIQLDQRAQVQSSRGDQAAEIRMALLERDVQTLRSFLEFGATLLGVVLALGGLASLYSLFRFEHRASEAHSLSISGERASQNRAAEVHSTFLEGSKTTLELVNSTLALAQEASERAAKFLENKARTMLGELDKEAKGLLASVPRKDDRALIADEGRRSNLRSLAQKLTGFEINRFLLPVELPLTPACSFMRGMDFHLNQQYQEAFSSWEQVALGDTVEPSLRSLAWYWIGYERNNLGQFSEAVRSFEQALDFGTGVRRFELERIILETRFFNKTSEKPEVLVPLLEDLFDRLDRAEGPSDEIEARKAKVANTLGNVLHVLGLQARDRSQTDLSRSYFQKAANHLSVFADQDKWCRFGLAEALYYLGRTSEAVELYRLRVRADAQAESIHRVEPRTKVLATTTELVCCLRVSDWNEKVAHLHSQVIEALGRVDQRLTVYSQHQRRNISKEEFVDDLRALEKELSESGDAPSD